MSLQKLAVSLAIIAFILLFTVNCASISKAHKPQFKELVYNDMTFLVPLDVPDFTQLPYANTGSQFVFDMDHVGIYFAITDNPGSAYFSILVTATDPEGDAPYQLHIVAMSRFVPNEGSEEEGVNSFWVFQSNKLPRVVVDADAVYTWLFENKEA